MNILVIGSGGREHAICWKIRQSKNARDIFCAPGNAGTAEIAQNVPIHLNGHEEHDEIVRFCKNNAVDLVVVGPEGPLAKGITDDLEKAGVKVFGPSYAASRLESSKIFAKEVMGGYGIPTAGFRVFEDFKKAEDHIRSANMPIVVKAYGLAAGKGVVIASTAEEGVAAARAMLVEKQFGSAGQRIIVEEFLRGEEASILVVTDGENVIPGSQACVRRG
jgi:phosphoribosylamine--glycine ligase